MSEDITPAIARVARACTAIQEVARDIDRRARTTMRLTPDDLVVTNEQLAELGKELASSAQQVVEHAREQGGRS